MTFTHRTLLLVTSLCALLCALTCPTDAFASGSFASASTQTAVQTAVVCFEPTEVTSTDILFSSEYPQDSPLQTAPAMAWCFSSDDPSCSQNTPLSVHELGGAYALVPLPSRVVLPVSPQDAQTAAQHANIGLQMQTGVSSLLDRPPQPQHR